MGRPRGPKPADLNPAEITKWASKGATQGDIALRLHISLPTLERRLQQPKFREAWEAGLGERNISLRSKQFDVAMEGDGPMLRWLGEQYLGQAHAHKLVDKEGNDRGLNIESVRAYMRAAPEEGEQKP